MKSAANPLVLLDTDICIYVLAGEPQPVRARFEAYEPQQVGISAVAVAEFMVGAVRLGLTDPAERLLTQLVVLPFDAAAARAYSRLPFRRGKFDRLIAAHALAADLVLITNKERDYRDIPGLKIGNWTKS